MQILFWKGNINHQTNDVTLHFSKVHFSSRPKQMAPQTKNSGK